MLFNETNRRFFSLAAGRAQKATPPAPRCLIQANLFYLLRNLLSVAPPDRASNVGLLRNNREVRAGLPSPLFFLVVVASFKPAFLFLARRSASRCFDALPILRLSPNPACLLGRINLANKSNFLGGSIGFARRVASRANNPTSWAPRFHSQGASAARSEISSLERRARFIRTHTTKGVFPFWGAG